MSRFKSMLIFDLSQVACIAQKPDYLLPTDAGRRTSTIVAVRQFRDRDSASGTAKKAGAEADQTSTELLDKANAYVDDLKVTD